MTEIEITEETFVYPNKYIIIEDEIKIADSEDYNYDYQNYRRMQDVKENVVSDNKKEVTTHTEIITEVTETITEVVE